MWCVTSKSSLSSRILNWTCDWRLQTSLDLLHLSPGVRFCAKTSGFCGSLAGVICLFLVSHFKEKHYCKRSELKVNLMFVLTSVGKQNFFIYTSMFKRWGAALCFSQGSGAEGEQVRNKKLTPFNGGQTSGWKEERRPARYNEYIKASFGSLAVRALWWLWCGFVLCSWRATVKAICPVAELHPTAERW